MNAVLGGWLMGNAMAILSTVALTYLGFQPAIHRFIQKYLDVPELLLAVPFSIGAAVVWAFLGTALGALYKIAGFEDEPGALLAPSWAFLVFVVVLGLVPLGPLLVIGRRYWWIWGGMSASFVALFGWAMPLLAER